MLLGCAWSLQKLELSALWYRMARPHATDTSSIAYNSAIFCRIAVMLVFNTDLLVLPSEMDALRTSQTRFYCPPRPARTLAPRPVLPTPFVLSTL